MPFLRVLDVHEFHPDGAAVGFPHQCQDLAEGCFSSGELLHRKCDTQVGIVETEGVEVQKRMFRHAGGEGIGAGQKVAKIPVAVNQCLDGGQFSGKLR